MYQRQVLPGDVGPITFLRAPLADFGDLRPGGVAVLGVPWDATCTTRPGTRYGPQGIRASSRRISSSLAGSPSDELVDLDSGNLVVQHFQNGLIDLGDVNVFPVDVERTATSISEAIAEVVAQENFPVILGGDHYITYPAFSGFARALQERGTKHLGYVQVDAHLDLSPEHKIWGKHSHGSNARLIAESGLIDPRFMVWMGVRGQVRREWYDFCRESGGHYITIKGVRELGVQDAVKWVGNMLQDCDSIYLSIDIDVVDSSLAHGTGAITFDGLTPHELLQAARYLSALRLGAVDLVEVAPNWDPSGVTERLAADVIMKAIEPRIFRTTT